MQLVSVCVFIYSCNCRVESTSKVVLKADTRLYIDDLFAIMIGKVSNLQRFISLEEINTFIMQSHKITAA